MCGSAQTFCFILVICIYSFLMSTCPFTQTLDFRKSLPVSTSVYITTAQVFPLSAPVSVGLSAHLPLSCQVLWVPSLYANVAAASWPRGDSLSLTALTADFTSNLLSLSSTAESCKCHYHFCHHNHQLKHQLLPFLHLLFKANDVAADAQNGGFICGISKVVSPCRSVHVLKMSEGPGETSPYATYSSWLRSWYISQGWKSSPPPPPQMNFCSYYWCNRKMSNLKNLCLRTSWVF